MSVSAWNNSKTVRHKYHERIASCLDDSVNLFRTILRPDIHSNNRSELTREGIKCYQVRAISGTPRKKIYVNAVLVVMGYICPSGIYRKDFDLRQIERGCTSGHT